MRHRRWERIAVVALILGSVALPLHLTTVAAPPDLEAQRTAALARVNAWRAAIGVPPIARHTALDKAAQAHAEFDAKHPGSVHNEAPGLSGFTGATMSDRARAAGYPSTNINENMGGSGDILTSLDWFVGTINHRLPLLDPRYVHIGFGIASGVEIIDFGALDWSETSETTWEQWPPEGASGIALGFSGESPDAFTGAKYPVGAPITLKYLGGGGVKFTGAAVTAGGKTVPNVAATGSGWLSRNTYIVATTSPMTPATDYRVTITGTAGGKEFTRAWGFRTKAAGAAENVMPGSAGVAVTQSVAMPTGKAMPSFPVAPPAPKGGYALPKGMIGMTGAMGAAGMTAVSGTWSANDGAVSVGGVARSWLFGPDAVTTRTEPYADAAGGKRTVVYFDKARMEITGGGVTNGLLVVEMTSGQVQTGDKTFRAAQPAAIPVAGDATGNADCPTYATLAPLASYGGNGRRATDRSGKPVIATLDATGKSTEDMSRAGFATAQWYEPTLGHNIPDVFAGWLGTLPEKWQTLVGLPITEPYWAVVRVDGKPRAVLMQAYERRVLTYTPDNPAAWQVEMGNVGVHYLRWLDK